MAVLLALVAALTYGLSDFVGGLVSRRTSPWAVAVLAQSSGAVCAGAVALLVPGSPTPGDLVWGALAGIGSGTGAAFLYRGFARGRMAVVAPVSAVGAALVPVAAGALDGERPALLTWLGIAVALPAIWLVAGEPTPPADEPTADEPRGRGRARFALSEGLGEGLLAGLGFGALFALLGQVSDGSGLWPTAAAQLFSIPAVLVLALALHGDWRPRGRAVWWATLAGPFAAAAAVTFLLASRQGLLTVSGVITSLYPASTVLLAALVLHERVHRVQGVGLLLCAVSVGLVVGS